MAPQVGGASGDLPLAPARNRPSSSSGVDPVGCLEHEHVVRAQAEEVSSVPPQVEITHPLKGRVGAERVREGIREAGGIAFEFPVHPIQETGKRPTAGLDRNLAYLGLVEVLFGYPLDGVVLTIGCDKTTPACLMAAATVNMPAMPPVRGMGVWCTRRSESGSSIAPICAA